MPRPEVIPQPFLQPAGSPQDVNASFITSGPVNEPHDTGVIQFVNPESNYIPVGIESGLTVKTEGGFFRIWDRGLPAVEAGKSLVLAETENFNFDSSNFGLSIDPIVSGSVFTSFTDSPQAFEFTDSARVLLGHEEAVQAAETTPFTFLGRINIDLPSGRPLLALTEVTCGRLTVRNLGDREGTFQVRSASFTSEGIPLKDPVTFTPDPPIIKVAAGDAKFIDISVPAANSPVLLDVGYSSSTFPDESFQSANCY